MRTKYVTQEMLDALHVKADEHDFRILVVDYLAELSRQVRDMDRPDLDAEWLNQFKKKHMDAIGLVVDLILYDMT